LLEFSHLTGVDVHDCDVKDKGRIWIGWDTSIWNCNIISSTLQTNTLQAVNTGGLDTVISIVYVANSATQGELLWQDLRVINQTYGQKPWTILGDFNTARYMD